MSIAEQHPDQDLSTRGKVPGMDERDYEIFQMYGRLPGDPRVGLGGSFETEALDPAADTGLDEPAPSSQLSELSSMPWRLPKRTKEIGRKGVAAARAELDAHRPQK